MASARQGGNDGVHGAKMPCGMVVLPQAHIGAFLEFCRLNPRCFPVVAVGTPTTAGLTAPSHGIDLLRDAPPCTV